MKIKIKSREEIEKTLFGRNHRYNQSCYFPIKMFEFCGNVFDAIPSRDPEFSVQTPSQKEMLDEWYWHKDWYEVVEEFTDEDLMYIELMNEMLAYFLEEK